MSTALTVQQEELLLQAIIGLPDVRSLQAMDLTVAEKATVIVALKSQLAEARALLESLAQPVTEFISTLEGDVFDAIVQSGGSSIPHDDLDVKLVRNVESVKDMPVLRELEKVLPEDDYKAAVFCKYQIKSTLAPETLAEMRKLMPGVRIIEEWQADGTKLNSYASANGYGPESEVGKIIAKGYYKRTAGNPRLIISEKTAKAKELKLI